MPDGFDPHRELARIYTLREVISAMREDAPTIISKTRAMLEDFDSFDTTEKIAFLNFWHDRAYGKPARSVTVQVETKNEDNSQVKTYLHLPDNGRGTLTNTGKIIDA